MTERLYRRMTCPLCRNPPITCGDSPPSSGALGREMSFGGRGEQQQTIM